MGETRSQDQFWAEIDRRSNLQAGCVGAHAVASAALAGYAVANGTPLLIGLVGPLAAVFGAAWWDHHKTIRVLGYYLHPLPYLEARPGPAAPTKPEHIRGLLALSGLFPFSALTAAAALWPLRDTSDPKWAYVVAILANLFLAAALFWPLHWEYDNTPGAVAVAPPPPHD